MATVVIQLMDVPAFGQRKRKESESAPGDLRLREAELVFMDGMKYFILEDYTKALGSFQRVAELNPQESMVYFKIAEIYSKSESQDDHLRAGASIEQAIRLNKKNSNYYLLAAEIYTKQNNFPKAEAMLETLTREVGDNGDHLYLLANIYQFDNKPLEAIKTYDRAEALFGINELSSLQKQKLYLDLGKLDEAIMEGEKLLAAFPDEERYVMGFAEILSKKGQQKKGIEYLEKFLKTHPESGSSKILLAGLYREVGRDKESRDLLMQAFEDPSVDISTKIIVLETYVAQITHAAARNTQDPDIASFAVSLYQQMIAQSPGDPNVYIAGGDLFLSLRQKDNAQRAFLGAVQHGSASFEAWQNLLSLESEAGNYDSLIFHSDQGLEIFPNQAMLYYYNGYGHLQKRHFREATFSLERAKRLSSANPALLHDINSMLGEAYNGTKEYVKSDAAYDAALAFNPKDEYVLNNYSFYLSIRKEHLEKAEHMSSQLIRDHPANASYLDTHAWVLYAREKFKEARKVAERALELPDTSAVMYEHYGDILFRLDDVDGAVRQWEKARSLTSQHERIDKKIANRRLY